MREEVFLCGLKLAYLDWRLLLVWIEGFCFCCTDDTVAHDDDDEELALHLERVTTGSRGLGGAQGPRGAWGACKPTGKRPSVASRFILTLALPTRKGKLVWQFMKQSFLSEAPRMLEEHGGLDLQAGFASQVLKLTCDPDLGG